MPQVMPLPSPCVLNSIRHFGLHVFHHSLVLIMAWGWLEYQMSTMFIGLVINTGVHVVMYTYYLLVALGFTITWKKLITLIQVMQFVTSFVCVMYTVSLVSAGNPLHHDFTRFLYPQSQPQPFSDALSLLTYVLFQINSNARVLSSLHSTLFSMQFSLLNSLGSSKAKIRRRLSRKRRKKQIKRTSDMGIGRQNSNSFIKKIELNSRP